MNLTISPALKNHQICLPAGWRWVRLGDICKTTSGGTPSRGVERYYGGSIPWVKSGELIDGKIATSEETITEEGVACSSAKIFPSGTLLIALYGATVGKLGLLEMSAATNQAVCAIFPSEAILRDFLFYFLLKERPRLLEMSFGGAQPNISQEVIRNLLLPLPPLAEQERIVAILTEQMAAAEKARAATEAQVNLCLDLIHSLLRESLMQRAPRPIPLGDCLIEITNGVGIRWKEYRLLGATRSGIAPAKEGVGKAPERYKLVAPGTIFYNPMRILLGSIAFVDEGDEPGITSPDYVVFRTREGVLHPTWFYFWLRSNAGADFIRTLTRGAVRERLLFNRLSPAQIALPTWEAQVKAVNGIKVAARVRRMILEEQMPVIEKLPAAMLRRTFGGEL